MRQLHDFSRFVRDGIARKSFPDTRRALSVIEDARKRKEFIELTEKAIGISDDNANYFVESAYEILVQLARAKLLADGYVTSGEGAHEAEISYLRTLHIPESDVLSLDRLRYHRNGIRYYGERFSRPYALQVMSFMRRLYPRLARLVVS